MILVKHVSPFRFERNERRDDARRRSPGDALAAHESTSHRAPPPPAAVGETPLGLDGGVGDGLSSMQGDAA